jgi:crossover junction endodeoxyribonuclease RuvC
MKALGIDPGLVVSGYGVLEESQGKIRLLDAGTIDSGDAGQPLELRLRELYVQVDGLIREHTPDDVALEQLYSHYEHPRTAILMGHARGVICLAAGMHDLPLHSYAPTEVKSALTGNGRASKAQIQRFVRQTFGLAETPRPPDVADAVAIALCHMYRKASEERMKPFLRGT